MADISQTIHNPVGIPLKGVKTLTAAETLTREDAGKLIVLNSGTAFRVTLPRSRKGYTFHFQVRTVPGATGHSVAPQTGDTIYFKGGGAASVSTAAINTQATAAIGDGLTLVGDGNGGYHAIAVNGTWARGA